MSGPIDLCPSALPENIADDEITHRTIVVYLL